MVATYDPSVLETVKANLASAMTPSPEDLFADHGPLEWLYFTEQCAWEALRMCAAITDPDDEDAEAMATTVGAAIEALGIACGALDGACAKLGILPPEAASVPGT